MDEKTQRFDMLGNAFRGKRVLVTGHTGFKGSWLSEWLLKLGADVYGYALEAPTRPALFDLLQLESRMHHETGDVRDAEAFEKAVERCRPDFVFHMAAQPLVRLSYSMPVETYSTNIMGTVNLLEALRLQNRPCTAIVVTSDKCYENRECLHSYSEEDPMGGYDPYSSSKGAAELIVSAYRRSYFSGDTAAIGIASVRSGNVIGGGDWARDRIVPDCIRALENGQPIHIRNRHATRPWQHVLEPLGGYLLLAAEISQAGSEGSLSRYRDLCSAFNFGPAPSSNITVRTLVEEIFRHWPGTWDELPEGENLHEAELLNLAIDKAGRLLGWEPVWSFERAVCETVSWYRDAAQCGLDPSEIRAMTDAQIDAYQRELTAAPQPASLS